MLIIGCDFHPGFQQVAIFDNLTGEIQEKRLQRRDCAEQLLARLVRLRREELEAERGPVLGEDVLNVHGARTFSPTPKESHRRSLPNSANCDRQT